MDKGKYIIHFIFTYMHGRVGWWYWHESPALQAGQYLQRSSNLLPPPRAIEIKMAVRVKTLVTKAMAESVTILAALNTIMRMIVICVNNNRMYWQLEHCINDCSCIYIHTSNNIKYKSIKTKYFHI